MANRIEVFIDGESANKFTVYQLPQVGEFVLHEGTDYPVVKVVHRDTGKPAIYCETPVVKLPERKPEPAPPVVETKEPPVVKTVVDKPKRKS